MAYNTSRRQQQAKKQKLILTVAVLILVVILVGITMMTTVLKKYTTSKVEVDYSNYYSLESEDSIFVVFDQELSEENGIMKDGEAYLPYNLVHNSLNKRFFWDPTEEVLRYTLPEGVVSITPDTKDYTVGKESRSADQVIAIVENGTMYMSLDFVLEYSDLHAEVFENPGRVVISDQWGTVEYKEMKQSTEIRVKGGVKSEILASVEKGTLVTVLEEMDNWSKICTKDGFIGYVKNKAIGSEQQVVYDSTFEAPVFTPNLEDHTINMAWHQVTNQTANKQVGTVLSATKGVNVISPTWFYLNDNAGGIESLASTDYVNYCHQQGVDVWGLVSNLEDPNVSVAEVLNVTSHRDNLVNNLISQAIKYNLDGINVDFEQLGGAEGAGFIQFIRELSLKCRNNDIVLSVDNYVPSNYTAFYSRDEQGVFADYVVLMAYDEHFNGSEEAGSVASIGFVEKGVSDTLLEVPENQLILGIPFYTRLWKLTPDESDSTKTNLSSEALGMSEAENRVSANGATFSWDEDCGQYYAQYDNEGSTYKIWLEDQNSIQEKLEVMKSNQLAGCAFWKLGYEKNTIWDTIVKYTN